MVAALYVLVFSLFFELSAAQYGVLFVLIGLVMALELINTALEAAGNAITKEKSPYIKVLKDTAAGAVLIFAIAAVAVAAVFFWDAQGFFRMYAFFYRTTPVVHPVDFGVCTVPAVYLPQPGTDGILSEKSWKKINVRQVAVPLKE